MQDFRSMDIETLLQPQGHRCGCGQHHRTELQLLYIGAGVINRLPDTLTQLHAQKPFVVCDQNTWRAAGEQAMALLDNAGIGYTLYVFSDQIDHVEPDEISMGSLTMAFDPACDIILAVGSGVINDCCRVLAKAVGRRSMVIATAPSMDGYASSSSSMIRAGIKVSIYGNCPVAIIADTSIVANAPMEMLQAGYGDMVAKHISLYEWKVSHWVTGEFYCENIVGLVRRALQKCTDSAPLLSKRDPVAVEAVMEGLVLSGVAMGFANNSRPASGLEHYFSHIWEMQALQRGLPSTLHGLQVGVGTCLSISILQHLAEYTPSREIAEQAFARFDEQAWETMMHVVFGSTAQALIDMEHQVYHKNAAATHEPRLNRILSHWKQIHALMQADIPTSAELNATFSLLNMPATPQALGIASVDVDNALQGSREIRDKYLTSSMLRDLGILDRFTYAGNGCFDFQARA